MQSTSDENLWSKILDDVQSRSSNSMPQASILVLGGNDSGKTTLVARLQRVEDTKKGSGMEYHYLEISPDFREGLFAYQLGSSLPDVVPGESTRLGVWVLDGDPGYEPLMKFAVNPKTLDKSCVLLCCQIAEPQNILQSLEKWMKCLDNHLNLSFSSTNGDESASYNALLRDCKEKQIRFWQEYLEPLDSSSHSEMGVKVPSMETDHILLPLAESVLSTNLGLPIIVVITKSDSISSLEKEYDFKEEHLDFIQLHIRRFCLRYGAALVYTSVKDGRNMDVLYKYILHRLYGFPFTLPACIVEKDIIFIPAGWDNETKIGILNENIVSFKPSEPYSEVIKKPVLKRPIQRDVEINSENEQSFLNRQLNILNTQAAPSPQVQMSPHRPEFSSPQNANKSGLNVVQSPAMVVGLATPGATSNKKPENVKGTPTAYGSSSQEGALAQFFNNLLTKKTPGSSPVSALSAKSGEKTNFANDLAAAELNRMLSAERNRKSIDKLSTNNGTATPNTTPLRGVDLQKHSSSSSNLQQQLNNGPSKDFNETTASS